MVVFAGVGIFEFFRMTADARPFLTLAIAAATGLVVAAYYGSQYEMMIVLAASVPVIFAGAVARLVVPGKQNLSIPMTILLGIIGSFVGGFLGYLLFRSDAAGGFLQPAGIIGSIIGAIIVLFIYLKVGKGRTATA